MTETSAYIQAYCVTCASPRYRSTRPLVVGKDTLSPTIFRALDSDGPPPMEGEAKCYVCDSALKFVREGANNGTKLERRPTMEDVAPTEEQTKVRELFKVGPEEKVINIHESNGSLVVVTNQRIVEVTI